MFAGFDGLIAIVVSLCGAAGPPSVLTSDPAVGPVEQIGPDAFFTADSAGGPSASAVRGPTAPLNSRCGTGSKTSPSADAGAAAPATIASASAQAITSNARRPPGPWTGLIFPPLG